MISSVSITEQQNIQQILALDARYNNNRNTAPHIKTLYMRRRSQLLREKSDRDKYFQLRAKLLSTKYPSVLTPSDYRSSSRAGSQHSRTCSMDSLDLIVPASGTPQTGRRKVRGTGHLTPNRPNADKDSYAFTDMPHIFDQHSKAVRLVRFAHNSCSLLACCSDDFTISLCSLSPYAVKCVLVGHSGPVRDMDWSIDNSSLLSASVDGTARLWSCDVGTCIRTVSSSYPLTAVRFQPMNNNVCVAGDEEGILRGYNLSTGKPLSGSRERVSNSLTCLEFGPNSSILWASNNKGQIYSVSVNMLTCQLKRLKCTSVPGGGSVVSLAVKAGHPSPLLLASSTSDLIFMFNIHKDVLLLVRKCSAKLNGLPIRSVFCPIATAQQGAFIVTGCADGSVLVFDMEKGKAVNKLQGHSCPVYGVCLSYDESLLISSDSSGTVIVWRKR